MPSSHSIRQRFKRLQHVLEWALAVALFRIFLLIGIDRASNAMGRFARYVGPCLPKNKVAYRNLSMAFPEWDKDTVQRTAAGVWENMGRYLAEMPHIAPMSADDFRKIAEIRGEENLHAVTRDGNGALFFSAHMANWELGAKASWACGVPFAIVYRPLNNPLADALTNQHRDQYQLRGLPKTAAGSRELLRSLRNGEPVAILIDQKMRHGQAIPFFGHTAMTSTAIADLAVKYGYPVIPTRVERLGHTARFRITFEPPVEWSSTGDAKNDALTLMQKLHSIMENWIRERPDQWFWVHRRWG